MGYYWKGSTYSTIQAVSTSDAMGQHKITGIAFIMTLL